MSQMIALLGVEMFYNIHCHRQVCGCICARLNMSDKEIHVHTADVCANC